jgi:hypothetical protein
MPPSPTSDGDGDEGSPSPIDELLQEFVTVEDETPFRASTCDCNLCTSTNTAVSQWDQLEDGNPVAQIVHRAVDATVPFVLTVEDNKLFLRGGWSSEFIRVADEKRYYNAC